MKKSIYYIILSLTFIGIPLFAFGILNSMVSLKYETENLTDCISLVSGADLCLTINVLKALTFLCIVSFIILLILRKRIIKNTEKTENHKSAERLNGIFDDILYQVSKGNSIEDQQNGIRHIELHQVKEWKSKFGFKFNIYGNDHFINNKPHFHFDNKQLGISCKMSFSGEIFECKGKKKVSRKTLKELNYFLSKPNVQDLITELWNDKNPKLKVKAST